MRARPWRSPSQAAGSCATPRVEVTARGERGVGGAAHVLYHLIGGSIAATDLDPPGSFALHFDDGHQLRIFDDSEDQESFSIQPGDVFV